LQEAAAFVLPTTARLTSFQGDWATNLVPQHCPLPIDRKT
jgi:hypothetical protein